MSYLIKLPDGQWLQRGKAVSRLSNASLYPHPSNAKPMLAKFPGAKLVPFEEVRDEWKQCRNAMPAKKG